MTRKHYKLIADVLKQYRRDPSATSIAASMACALKRDNPRFDPEIFIEACGINDYDSGWIK